MSRIVGSRWSAETLAISLQLALLLGLYGPANDNATVETSKGGRRGPVR